MKKYIHVPTPKELAAEKQAEDLERRKAVSAGDSVALEESNP